MSNWASVIKGKGYGHLPIKRGGTNNDSFTEGEFLKYQGGKIISGGTGGVSGYSGASGVGTSGYSGAAGTSGYSGTSGCSGISGYSGYGSALAADTSVYGFLNRTQTSISFDGVDTLILADTGGGWSYYRTGAKYTISGNKTKQILAPVDGTQYFFFIDTTNGNLSYDVVSWTLNDTKVPVATVYWDSTLTPKFILGDERHTCIIDRGWHREHHFVEGTQYMTPGTVTGLIAGSDTPSNKTCGISGVQIFDEDLFYSLQYLPDPDGATPVYYNVYRTSTTTWAWEISDMPFKYTTISPGVYGFIEYDNGSGASTQTIANRFVNTYIYVANSVSNTEANPEISTGTLRYFIVQGRGNYTTAALAAGESFASFSLTGFPSIEGVALYQITWATTNRPDTVKGRCRYVSTQRISANVIQTSIAATTSHNTLAGLQGGAVNEYYHLTDAEYTGLSSLVPYTGASSDVDLGAHGITLDEVNFNDTNTQIWEDGSGNLTFKDAVAGTITLSDIDCPKLLYITSTTGWADGTDFNLLDNTNWNVSKSVILEILAETTSTNWDLFILQNDNGFAADDAIIKKRQIAFNENGNVHLFLNMSYVDEDVSGEIHFYYRDNAAAATLDKMTILGVKAR